jgi:hypothetical protein
MFSLLTGLDWPNILAGAALSSAIAGMVWLARSLHSRATVERNLPARITGIWYSVEYDTKGSIDHDERNTFLKVKIAKTLSGDIRITSKAPLLGTHKALATGWIVRGRVVGDTVVGEWFSTVAHSTRHGVAMIKFLDYGRAVGYWVGVGGSTYPIYGYWILDRNEADLKTLAAEAIKQFSSYDIGYLVAHFDRHGSQPPNVTI